MRILWVKAGKLLPVDTGGKIRSYNLLRQLATRHELRLLSYYGGDSDESYEAALRREFPLAETICDGTPQHGPRLYLDYASNALSPLPYAVGKFTSRPVRDRVERRLSDGSIDVAVCDFLSASANFPRRTATPCVLFQHNVESELWQRQAAHEPGALKRLAFAVEAAKMLRYERAAVRRFPRVIAVSARDREAMARMTDAARIDVVPTGVDVEQYRHAAPAADPERPVVMFLGSMDWEANVDAVDHFCRDIWPAVVAAVPAARFRIVGRAPHPRVLRLASPSVEITGRVPSAVDELARATVFVVPLRVGGGTRLKIFEAMAAGRAVVSTSIGAEGLEVSDGDDILLADAPDVFAASVVTLLNDAARRRQIEIAAAATAARHDWPAISLRFEEVLRAAMGERGSLPEVAAQPARIGA